MLLLAVGVVALFGTISCQTVVNVDVPDHGRVTFQSTNFPSLYPNNQHVRYVIRGPEGYGLQFDVETEDIQWGNDYMSLIENVKGKGIVIFGQGRGPTGAWMTTRLFQSLTNQVNATFKSDGSIARQGFKIGVRSAKFAQFSDLKEGTLVVNCTRGNLTWSEEKFLETDRANLMFVVDRTFPCRQMMYDTHWHVLEEIMGRPNVTRSGLDGEVVLTCNANGFSVSQEAPDDVEAGRLLFKTSGNLKCRKTFTEFLKYISEL